MCFLHVLGSIYTSTHQPPLASLLHTFPFQPGFACCTVTLVTNSLQLLPVTLVVLTPADTISELKLGNGTSVLIFANIASSLPTSVGALLAQNTESDPGNIAIYATAFFLTTLGIIYVQEAERRIPVNYSSR